MKIGQLRHRVTIQAPEYTRATDGSTTINYVGSTTIWAQVKMLGQVEGDQASKQTSTTNIEVLVRYNTITELINQKYQLVWDGVSYGITGITDDERKTSRTIIANAIK